MTDAGEWLTRGSAIVALACYAFSLGLRMSARGRHSRLVRARVICTIGCGIFLAHVMVAFQLVHHWSHAAAYEATARETFEVVGWNWGGGLFANYAFTAVWLIDVLWWWRGLESYEARSRWIDWVLYGFLAFMAFNATVVFGEGPARWFGMVATIALLIVWAGSLRQRTATDESAESSCRPWID